VILMMGVIIVFIITGVTFHQTAAQHGSFPTEFLLFFPMIWLIVLGWWIFILVVAVVYGIKAGRGEWAEYPVLGSLARGILGIGPGGQSRN